MPVYSVSYDLRVKNHPKYKDLEEEIQRSPGWYHLLESTWLVVTGESAEALWRRLATHLHKVDLLFIVEVKRHYYGWLPQAAWTWIDEVFPQYVVS